VVYLCAFFGLPTRPRRHVQAAEQKLRAATAEGTASAQRVAVLQAELEKQASKFETDTGHLREHVTRLQNELLEAQVRESRT